LTGSDRKLTIQRPALKVSGRTNLGRREKSGKNNSGTENARAPLTGKDVALNVMVVVVVV
jgi:hypothetical protein